MNPSEVREQLLRQHRDLRVRLAACVDLASRHDRDEAVLPALRQALAGLRGAFAEHNEAEEALLGEMLLRTEGWGPRRVARMFEEHLAEHRHLRELLAGDAAALAPRIAELADDLDAHMAAEERTFLSPAVLRDSW